MAEPASDFVTSPAWCSAPEPTPTVGLLSDTAPLRDNWMLWAMWPPPPPPSSSPPAGGSEPSSEAQLLVDTRLHAQILPGAQPHLDTQSRLDSQPHINGQPSWQFQASTSWYWRQSPGSVPWHQKSHNTPGRLLLRSMHPPFPSSPLFSLPFLLSPLFALPILRCTLGVCSLMSHNLSDRNFPHLFIRFSRYLLNPTMYRELRM